MSSLRWCAVALLIVLMLSDVNAANNRPLLYGMNPTPMDWWGYDESVWDPLLFAKMKDGGCTVARIGVGWDVIEPTPGMRNWGETDRWVKYCLDNNIEPLILINSTATWALPQPVDPAVQVPEARYPPAPEYAEVFSQYVYDLVRRYRGRVRYYEFWNEANGYGWYTAFLNPQSFHRGDLYTPWMIRAYKAVKLADPTAMMSTTGIDDNGGGATEMLNNIYAAGGKGYFDAVADHPYSPGNLDTWKLDNIRALLNSKWDSHVKVWITEYGYPMNANNYSAYQQYIINYFNSLTLNQYEYVTISSWHTANEFPWEHGYGLLNSDLTEKPPFQAFKAYPKPARPNVFNVSVTNLTPTSVRVNYTTGLSAKTLVMYGETTNYGSITGRETSASTTHQIVIEGLKPGTLYNYRIRAGQVEDGDGFSANYTFTTQSGPVVNTTSGPTVTNLTNNSATINWTTDVPSSSSVSYGTNFNYGNVVSSAALTTSHSAVLTNLQTSTIYQFRVKSEAAGYAAGGAEGYGFRTLEGPQVIIETGPVVASITATEATITWTTNIPASSTVRYSTDLSYSMTAGSNAPVTQHSVNLQNLTSLTTYRLKVESGAVGYNTAIKDGGSFQTAAAQAQLLNGGFENGLQNWTFWEVYPYGGGTGHIAAVVNTWGGTSEPNPNVKEGSQRLTLNMPVYATGVGGIYQTVNTGTGRFLVSGWMAAGCDGGNELVQLIAKDGAHASGYPTGTVISSLSSTSGWVYVSKAIEVNSGQLTVYTLGSQYWGVLYFTGYFDGLTITPLMSGKVSGFKQLSPGQWVTTQSHHVVSAVVDNQTLYLQQEDRSCGIRVKTASPHALTVGTRASVYGQLAELDGELVIQNAGFNSIAAGAAPKALSIANRSVGGEQSGVQQSVNDNPGLNNVGLLVKLRGKAVDAGGGYMTVDDGSGQSVRCKLPTGTAFSPAWNFVTVTGISSLYTDNLEKKSLLLIRTASDIVALN